MSVCDENCRDCVFRTTLSRVGIICNYLGVMGRRRDCPAGKGCLRKVRGPKRESLEAGLYKIPPNPERKASAEDNLSTASRSPSPEGEANAEDDLSTAARSQRKRTPTAERRVPSRGISPEGEANAEEAARIAEKKRKKAEQHRAWVARNREHLREYQQEYRKKKMEETKDGETDCHVGCASSQ